MKKQPPRALVGCVEPKLDSLASSKKIDFNPKSQYFAFAKALWHLRGEFACNVHIGGEKY